MSSVSLKVLSPDDPDRAITTTSLPSKTAEFFANIPRILLFKRLRSTLFLMNFLLMVAVKSRGLALFVSEQGTANTAKQLLPCLTPLFIALFTSGLAGGFFLKLKVLFGAGSHFGSAFGPSSVNRFAACRR